MVKQPVVVKFAYSDFEYNMGENKWSAVCRHCKQKIREKRGTTSGFVRHLKNKHPLIHCEYVAQKPCSEKELNQRVVAKKPCCTKEEDQSPTDYFVMEEDIEKYKPLHEDQLHLTKSLLENLIIGCNLPPSIVEDQHFLQFLEDMNPKFCVPSCTYIEAELANYIHV